MSVAATTWAIKQQGGGPGPKAVLLALAHHADANGECYPSQPLLAEECEMGISTVRNHLATLESRAVIERFRRHRRNGSRTSNGYRLKMSNDGVPVTTLPPESGGSLQPDLGGSLAPESGASQPPESGDRTDLPPDLGGSPPSSDEDKRQISATLPPDLEGPTTFERSVEEQKNRKVAAVAVGPAPPARGRANGHTPAHTHDGSGGDEIAVAIERMQADAERFGRFLPADQHVGFVAAAEAVISRARALWHHPRSKAEIPWTDRPDLFMSGLANFLTGERKSLRAGVRLALQQELDPFAPKIQPGTEAYEARRNEAPQDQVAPRTGRLESVGGGDASELGRIAEWEQQYPDDAAWIVEAAEEQADLNPMCAKFPNIREKVVRSFYRQRVLAAMQEQAGRP